MDSRNSSPSHANSFEVIADSEEEPEYGQSFSAQAHNQQLRPNTISSISDFTSIAFGVRSDEIETLSIADRTKTRQRRQPTQKPLSCDFIELTSDDDLIPIKKRTTNSGTKSIKPKPKTQAKANASMAEKPLPSVDATDSERPRPRPRPRPRLKQTRPKLDSDILPPHPYPFAQDPSVYNIPSIQLPPASTPPSCHRSSDLPVATINNYAMAGAMISQLPPSDPPTELGTSFKSSRSKNDPLPPIEILQDNHSEHEGNMPLSHPSSLFSDTGSRLKAKKKIKSCQPENEREIDQLVPSSPFCGPEEASRVGPPVFDAYTHGEEPPPTFFAGSSSIGRQDITADLNAISEPKVDIVDLTDLPATLHCAKSSKSKKRKVEVEINPDVVLCADDGDSDFEPSGKKSGKKRKGKGKLPTKEKENKPKEKKANTRKKEFDGVILQPRDKSRISKTKGKQVEKEAFKSREFIDNSDEDLPDPLLLTGGLPSEGLSLPSTTVGMISPKPSASNHQDDFSSPRGKSPESKVAKRISGDSRKKATLKSKKRKSIVESDEGESEDQVGNCSVVKKRKAPFASASDEEVERVIDENAKDQSHDGKSPRGRGTSITIGPEDEVEITGNAIPSPRQEETIQERSGQLQRLRKENAAGPSSPPVRFSMNRASSINLTTSTPLYTRYEVAPRRSSLPMSELIRRASSKPGSPFPLPGSFTPSKGKKIVGATDPASTTPLSRTAYSPYLKMSRRALSKIAPLHLNRKTPPPPPPPPPPKKKTKKELEMEERWEEEMVESVGGIEVWASMGDSERKEMRKAKWEAEMGGYD